MAAPNSINVLTKCPHCRGGYRLQVDGGNVRKMRESKGLSLRELARRMKISASYLCDIELGRRQPAKQTARLLRKALR